MEDSIDLQRNRVVNAIYKIDIYQNFALIDNRITWYGNVSLLGYDSMYSNVLRLEGADVAMQLKDVLET